MDDVAAGTTGQSVTTSGMTNVRWRIFFLILGTVAINYIDRASLSVAMPMISREFSISPAIQGLQDILGQDSSRYIPAVILMTDGQSNTGKTFTDLQAAWSSGGRDIPVFAILFGDASETQLREITNFTRGNIFDGRTDMISAFRKAKGYN